MRYNKLKLKERIILMVIRKIISIFHCSNLSAYQIPAQEYPINCRCSSINEKDTEFSDGIFYEK